MPARPQPLATTRATVAPEALVVERRPYRVLASGLTDLPGRLARAAAQRTVEDAVLVGAHSLVGRRVDRDAGDGKARATRAGAPALDEVLADEAWAAGERLADQAGSPMSMWTLRWQVLQ